MAKALMKVAMIAGAVALVATGVGAAAGAGLLGTGAMGAAGTVAGISTATISTVASVATVVAAAASVGAYLMAKKPGAAGAVNQVTISANAPIPYGVGRCFYAGSQLHDVGYGGKAIGSKTKNPWLSKVFVWSAGGPVEEIEAFLMDWQTVNFTGTSALGYYSGWLWHDRQLGLRPEADALAPPPPGLYSSMPDWGPAYKLSGYAASLLTFKFDRDNKKWANGIPAFGVVGKWARVYDPRNDSTYPGGSGDHRFDDEDTFEFDRNAALNAITYARGRYAIDTTTGEQTMKIVGCGFPKDAFDWPQWVAFANVCEANGWNSDGTVFDGPGISLWDNLKRMCAAGGGVPVISGGLLSVRFQSPKVALDTITAEDFADGERIVPGMRTYRDRINTMVPKYRSEANKWEYVQSAAVSFEEYVTLDGELKEEEYLCELVTDKDQAAQLTAYELFNRRELSGITIPCKPRLWEARLGEAYQVQDPETGLNHLCVIAAITKDIAQGTVTLTFETETSIKHALALAMTGTAPPPPTLVPPGDSDDASWDNGTGGMPTTPTGWTLMGQMLTGQTGSVPLLIVQGAVGAGDIASEIIFEYRPYNVSNGPDDNWTGSSLEAPLLTRKEVVGIVAGVDYEVSVRYRSGTLIGDRLILGPVAVNAWAATAVLANGGNVSVAAAGDGLYTITKTGGSAGWDASAVSTTGIAGGAVALLRAPASGADVIAGLATAPNASDSYTDIPFAVYFGGGGSLFAAESGSLTAIGTWSPGDTIWIVQALDGTSISYRKGSTLTSSTLLRTVSTSSTTFYFDSSIVDVGRTFVAGLFKRLT